jgi:transcription elongation GreA/GreB family factor
MEKELILLDEDKLWARNRIEELEKQIQALGPEFYDVFNQSSETWHDNAPFDALRDRQSVLDAELQELRRILRSSAISIQAPIKGIVGVGSTVILENGKRYFIAGDWTPVAGQVREGAIVISRGTPLAGDLLGKKVGDPVLKTKIKGTGYNNELGS